VSAPEPSLAVDGRALGRRGAETRRRLLEATAKLLEHHGVRDLRVVEITRAVGTSPATFYQYFHDVPEAVLALAEEVGEDLAPIGEVLDGDWTGHRGLDAARVLVEKFITFWDEHRAVLRTRNLAAQEGDDRFRAVRNAALRPMLDRLASRIAASQRAGAVAERLSAPTAAAALMAMLERMAAFHEDLAPYGASRDDVVETTARIVFETVTGSRPID